ncbi:ABC transporter permease [Borrelia parkeri]|uniref:Oligopeptide transport system permease protein oppB n=1 Tax=Borrelia parkeri SLO TaxID=1313294 RepID=A0ABN4C500_BORPR|nr:ABC transporter permease [Borrelia parkeri]AHE63055.1 peptide ABC transporter permease [Borrelia parkeri HR1]AHH09175.1 Oligopeptide transport system permease protein oppB [Borrelia parkeri SLO]UPA10876.1 ABC transporter permease [Borrelia parkeri]
MLLNAIISTFFCISLLNIFSNNNNSNIPFIQKNIFKDYLEYIGILKSIESYKLIYDFDPNIPLSKDHFVKHIVNNLYIVYETKYKGVIWGKPHNSPLTNGKSSMSTIFSKMKNTLKISIPGIVLSYVISIFFIIIWTLFIKNKILNNILEYIMLFLHSLPRNLTVILIVSLLYYLKVNPKNLIIGGFAWFFSFFIFNAVIFKQSLDKNLSEFYIISAKSRGIKNFKIITVHALIPSLVPLITNLRPTLATAFFGSSFIEIMFGIDGIGTLTINAIKNNDYIVYRDLLFVGVFIMLIPNLITDIVTYNINPYKDVLE